MTQDDVINSLPAHLRPFVAIQDYAAYTPEDQAVWRFLLHELKRNLSRSAHPVYLEGLAKTGISLEHIPRIEHMNECLSHLGWRAVVVNGFIPPIVFMEFQALKVLAIATEMRAIEHMLYTPAPDIVHEAAGHAPFIVDQDYAEFLQQFGQLGMRAIATCDDHAVYEAIRHLSIVKAAADTSPDVLADAQQRLSEAIAANHTPSEAALLARLHWWTIEYGLVGSPRHYQLFGAGLLSSLGESVNCLDDKRVKKWPLTVNAVATPYDITCEQPQLFVARNCRHLSQVLNEFGRRMCVNRGGDQAVDYAIQAGSINTAVTNAGLEISGRFSRVIKDSVGNISYLTTSGPTQLAYAGEQLQGHGSDYHHDGFGSPIGRLQGLHRCLSEYSIDELKEHAIAEDNPVTLEFLSGIQVSGLLRQIVRRQQKNILFSLSPCQVTDLDGRVLFDPDWGVYDMAVGDSICSVYGGSADQLHFPLFAPPEETASRPARGDAPTLALYHCYAEVRRLREAAAADEQALLALIEQAAQLPQAPWLLCYELLELAQRYLLALPASHWLSQQLTRLATSGDDQQAQLIRYARQRLEATANPNAGPDTACPAAHSQHTQHR